MYMTYLLFWLYVLPQCLSWNTNTCKWWQDQFLLKTKALSSAGNIMSFKTETISDLDALCLLKINQGWEVVAKSIHNINSYWTVANSAISIPIFYLHL